MIGPASGMVATTGIGSSPQSEPRGSLSVLRGNNPHIVAKCLVFSELAGGAPSGPGT